MLGCIKVLSTFFLQGYANLHFEVQCIRQLFFKALYNDIKGDVMQFMQTIKPGTPRQTL